MLSILHREMRVASRKRWTFRVRLLTNIIAFVLSAPLIIFGSQGASGGSVFNVLTFAAFFFCLIQGVRQAANSISDEKREGTLGLLFLTDLTPLEIVGGKLCGIVLPMLQPLMAFVPFLSISMLLGGVTFGEVARVSLVFASVLLLSVSIGLFVSSANRRAESAANATLVSLLILVFFPRIFAIGPLWFLRYMSPWTAFARVNDGAFRMNLGEYWLSLVVTISIGLLALLAAAFFLPRRWEQFEVIQPVKKSRPVFSRRYSNADRAKILDRSPGEWLALRHAMSGLGQFGFNLFVVLFAGAAGLVAMNVRNAVPGMFTLLPAILLILLRLASQASYPLAEAKRSGAIEMLLSTPMKPETLVRGQIAALWTQFRVSVGAVVGALIAIALMSLRDEVVILFPVGIGMALCALWISTAAAVGMWMGLRENSPNAAFFKTVLFAFAIPLFPPLTCSFGPIIQIILFGIACSRLSGKELRRLLGADRFTIYETVPPPLHLAGPMPPRIS